MNTPPLTRSQLDSQGCDEPGCTEHGELFVHSRCHPHAKLEVVYRKATGCIETRCGTCRAMVAIFQVAP